MQVARTRARIRGATALASGCASRCADATMTAAYHHNIQIKLIRFLPYVRARLSTQVMVIYCKCNGLHNIYTRRRASRALTRKQYYYTTIHGAITG